MQKTTVTINNKLGLHARASSTLATLANEFSSQIHLSHNNKTVNAKSIIEIMMLAASKGSNINIAATGADEDAAMIALQTLINDKFGEDE